jgi:N-acetyl-1-D-myo-inositol-2-amino-2-deoxy-alpha-D-glucopyranoside deacetylase
MDRRSLLLGASGLAAALAAPAIVNAQGAFPSRPLRLIVPWPPGQATDLMARVTASKIAESWGQPFVPENRAGAGGMIGTDPNERPDNFWNADFTVATSQLAKIIDEIKPHILITYDEIGGYGHPDHIQAHRVAMAAAELSVWKIAKIYWNVMPRSVIQQGIDAMTAVGSDFMGVDSADDLPFAKDDSFVTAHIDGNEYVEAKMSAMRAHATQIAVDGPFFALSNNLGLQVWGNEYYTLVKGEKSAPFDDAGREVDLFAGVTLP